MSTEQGRLASAISLAQELKAENAALRAENTQLCYDMKELYLNSEAVRKENAALGADLVRMIKQTEILGLELTQRRSEAATRGLRVEVLENALANLLRYSVGQRGFDGREEAKKLLGWAP